jgi:hypothetical protein
MFLPGLQLCRRYYHEAVEPLLRTNFPDLEYTAARIGPGSEILGFDTERSADHDWGPRLQLFTEDRHEDIRAMLTGKLPQTFLGHPTNFGPAEANGVRVMEPTDGPVHHRVDVTRLDTWFAEHLGFDPRHAITAANWLETPPQIFAEATGGAVFHDALGLESARGALAWYPAEIWRQVLSREWRDLAEEEAFVGRCGEVGDELGSAVVAAHQVRRLMRLCLFMNRRYPPYSKWLGSAFARLPLAALGQDLVKALAATDWQTREQHLTNAYEAVAALHNDLRLTPPLDEKVQPYHNRPFLVIHADRFADALVAAP